MSKRKADEKYSIDFDEFNEKYHHSKSQVDTKLGSKRTNAIELHTTAARLLDVKSLLVDATSTLANPNASKTSTKAAIKIINKSILPTLDIAASTSRVAANVVSPIARSEYVHKRVEADNKRELHSTSPLLRVIAFVGSNHSPVTTKSKPPHKKSQPGRQVKGNKLPISISAPVPKNGKEYGVGEFIKLTLKYRKGTAARSAFLNQVLAKKFVKKDMSTLHRVLRHNERKQHFYAIDAPWNDNGRPPLLTNAEVKIAVQSILSSGGEKEMLDTVNEILLEKERKNGGLPESSKRYNPQTLKNYFAYMADQAGITITDLSVPKSPNRWIRERSIIGAMAFAVTTAMAHSFVVPIEDPTYRAKINKIPIQDRLLYDMVSDVYGNKPIQFAPANLIVNADETTKFITQGTQPSNSRTIGLVSQAAYCGRDSFAICHREDSKQNNGLRIKRMLITNMCGDVAPPVLTVKVSRHEMPHRDILPVRIQGLCRGGGGLYGSTGFGYLLFVVKQEAADKAKNEWIQNNALLPFIQDSRTHYGESDFPQANTAKYWSDSDPPNVEYLTSKDGLRMLDANDITAMKHGAARTAGEQANDNMRTFVIEKEDNRNTTMEDVPSNSYLLKARIQSTLDDFDKRGILTLKKKGVVVDFAAKFPDTLVKSTTRRTVVGGYVRVGHADSTLGMLPVLQAMLGTCRRPPTPIELELCVKYFKYLLGWSLHNGM